MIWSDVTKADNPWTRLRGLLGRQGLSVSEGLLIVPCQQIHMFFMRFALDLVFLDQKLSVLKVMTLQPWQVSPLVRNAHAVLEVPAGSALLHQVSPGTNLTIKPNP